MCEETEKIEIEEKELKPRKKRLDGRSFLLGFFISLSIFAVLFIILTQLADKEKLIRNLIHRHALGEVSDEAIDDGKYHGMVSAFGDKYAAYFNTEEYAAQSQKQSGAYVGIGIVFVTEEDPKRITVVHTYEGSPGAEAGVLPGDELIAAADMELEELTVSALSEKIREGLSPVEMTFLRDGEPYTVSLVPGEVVIPTVYYEYKDGVACISISNFRETTPDQFKEAYAKMKEDGAKALILDLRENGGGLVSSVVDVMKQFIPEGLLVYTKDNAGNTKEYKSRCKDPIDIPVAVLVNGDTASAAEILAGAIRDRGVGILVGTQTFGKGIVQSTYQLPDQSAVKLTTASYFTPDGTDLNGTGLTPDVEAELPADAYMDWGETDSQYAAALDALSEYGYTGASND